MRINCFDLGEHKYTIPCYEKLKETFGERINIVIGDSTKTLLNVTDMYDLIHIDGGHTTEVAESDIINSYRVSKKGTILIMDDYDFHNLHYLWDNYIIKYNLKNLNINIYNSPHHDIKYVCAINIPKILFQTNKTCPDTYLLDMIKCKLSSDWKYEFYNDNDVIQFFINNPLDDLPDIIKKYNSIIKCPHKEDLFRYYYLYINGGFFMDSDAMLYVNIDNIVKEYNFISVNSSCVPGTIFQGILGASPKNKIIKRALYQAYNTDPSILDNQYHYFCKQLYDIIKKNNHGYNIKLYEERRIHPAKGDDILDKETVLFKHYWYTKVIPMNNSHYTDEFTKIYNTNYWIKGSGSGSYIENTIEYNKYIIDFIKKHNINSITDIGCGDWQSSYLIYQNFVNIDYLGLDCVNFIIEKNKTNHPKYNFKTLDILSNLDLIRDSELYIIKDVLQHWKLNDIYDFLDKLVLKKFKYIIITNNGNQTYDNLELNTYIGNGRGLNSKFLPLKKYNSELLLEYFGDETKHMCIIKKDTCLVKHIDPNPIKLILENKKYSWGNSYIKFLDNFKMDAFGGGDYKVIDKQNIIANFGFRIHNISFNNDYTEFTSTRKDDLQIVNGKQLI